MKFDQKPNFRKAKEATNLTLLSSKSVNSFPYEITKLVEENNNIKCTTFKKAKEICPDLKCEDLGSDDAILVGYHNKYLILINNDKYTNRIRFSIGHEFGHYILKHNLEETNIEILSKYEVEANFFAAQLLMPEEIINELLRRRKTLNIQNIQDWFSVSCEAAQKRYAELVKYDYYKRTSDEQDEYNELLSKFKNYLDLIAPVNACYEEDISFQEG